MSAVMSCTKRGWLAIAAVAVVRRGRALIPATALADPETDTQTDVAPAADDGLQHNVTYRARADGTSRGAVVAYKIDDTNVNSDQPTLLPGATFEVNTVLSDPKLAGMTVSIEWPYGSNLHCEILVDDEIVAQADQFIAPRLFRVKDDPLYGTLQCGAALDTPVPGAPAPEAPPADGAVPPAAYALPGASSRSRPPMPWRANRRRGTTAPSPRRNPVSRARFRLAAR